MNIDFEDLLNLATVEVTHLQIEKSTIRIYCQAKISASFCPHCLAKNSKINQTQEREIRDLPIMGKKSNITSLIPPIQLLQLPSLLLRVF